MSKNSDKPKLESVNTKRMLSGHKSPQKSISQTRASVGSIRMRNVSSVRSLQAKAESDLPESLGETTSSAQFIIKSIMVAYDMHMKQAAALLSDNHRYLYHMCIKGMKGSNFTRVEQWYHLMLPHADHLIQLINEELNKKPARPPRGRVQPQTQ